MAQKAENRKKMLQARASIRGSAGLQPFFWKERPATLKSKSFSRPRLAKQDKEESNLPSANCTKQSLYFVYLAEDVLCFLVDFCRTLRSGCLQL
jgi:hypothetical protein